MLDRAGAAAAEDIVVIIISFDAQTARLCR
jgi:hypothetical protein